MSYEHGCSSLMVLLCKKKGFVIAFWLPPSLVDLTVESDWKKFSSE